MSTADRVQDTERPAPERILSVWLGDHITVEAVGGDVELTLDWGTDDKTIRIDREGAARLRAALYRIERHYLAEESSHV